MNLNPTRVVPVLALILFLLAGGAHPTDAAGPLAAEPESNGNTDAVLPPASSRSTTALDAGARHTCALLPIGDVVCWGDNATGQSSGYRRGDAVAIAAGERHTCALRADGNVTCWGANGEGQAAGYDGGDAIHVDAAAQHTCVATTRGRVHCWGSGLDGRTDPYDGGDAVSVALGDVHTCALLQDGDVRCWGGDWQGQTRGHEGQDAIAVSAGRGHTCALLLDGSVTCWGDDCCGESGGYQRTDDPAASDTVHCRPSVNRFGIVNLPRPYGCVGTARAVAIGSGGSHTCAVMENGNTYCWGLTDGTVASDEGGDAVAYAGGGNHGCALTRAGTIRCWGSDSHGQAADFPPHIHQRLATGASHSCVLHDDVPVCWGDVPAGGSPPTTQAVQLAAGPGHTCALLQTGNVQCWGQTTEGKTDAYTGGDAVQVAVGGDHTCALLDAGAITCWGAARAGQAGDYVVIPGDGDQMACDAPRLPDPPDAWAACAGPVEAVEVAAGAAHTCARLADGRVYCWGSGYSGHVRPEPVALVEGDAVQLRAGWNDTCALLVGGEVRCWQDDYTMRPMLGGIDEIVEITVGDGHVCALLATGAVHCEGENATGQAARHEARDVVQVAAGASHTCALLGSGEVTCWGADDRGQSAGFLLPTPQAVDRDGVASAFPWWLTLLPPLALAALTIGVVRARQQASTVPVVGQTFLGKYVIVRRIGLGGFGAVWLARHTRMDRHVVIKQLQPQWTARPEVRARFDREAQILATLDHPNITRIHDVEEVAEDRFLIMEYVDGGTLKDWVQPPTADDVGHTMAKESSFDTRSRPGPTALAKMRPWLRRRPQASKTDPDDDTPLAPHPHVQTDPDGTFITPIGPEQSRRGGSDGPTTGRPVREVGPIMLDVLAGLAYLHEKGVQHRDMKPSNILLTQQGQAKIADFGVSRQTTDHDVTLTATDIQPGTPQFMAPEQIAGKESDARTDIYATAATFYWALTGRSYLPRPSAGLLDLHRQVLDEAPRLPVPRIGRKLNAWLARGLAKDADKRFQTAEEAHKALEAALRSTR